MSNLQLKNIVYKVNDSCILNDVSTTFKEKTLTCILGPNGAGKTTLIKSIARLVDSEGVVFFNEQDTSFFDSHSLARKIAYVPQSVSQDLNFTVEDFTLLSRYPWQGVSNIEGAKVDEVLNLTGLEPHRKQSMKTLSGGERQRALIAAALIQETDIILLDEITSALDPKFQDQVIQLLLKIRDQGKTLIWATHDINASLLYADQLLALKEGKVFSSGTPKEFLENDTFQKLYERSFEKLEYAKDNKTVLI